ncbi:MAG: UDP-glucose/GDP-mannose dehydrogenase family protein [Acidobacteria bacterium]|nr:UDP-glucose/GDP-mannose dehydrogenase family protein [Acidobacteriota bacterium]
MGYWDARSTVLTESFPTARVAVFGLGYVGSVTAACLASLGHQVTGVDRDAFKAECILKGKAPFFEPGLEELIATNVSSGRLSAATCARQGIAQSDIGLLCVGTPSERNGNLRLDHLKRVVDEIAGLLSEAPKPYILVVRSTVFPGTCEQVVAPAVARLSGVSLVSNPEFLREGCAVQDFLQPSLVVVGGNEEQAVRRIASLYAALKAPARLVSLRTAEMIKYACNAFHAVKVAFANEIGALSEKSGASAHEVMDTLCLDRKLNISPAYLKPGFAFGGSCLPKDLRAIVYRGSRLDLKLPLLEAALPSNQQHLERAIQQVIELPAARIGFLGLAFKENTDDLRESPVIEMLERLIGKGRDVRVYDPHVQLSSIYGSNREFLLKAIPHIGRLLSESLDELLAWADHLVITQKPQAQDAEELASNALPVLNLAGASLITMGVR